MTGVQKILSVSLMRASMMKLFTYIGKRSNPVVNDLTSLCEFFVIIINSRAIKSIAKNVKNLRTVHGKDISQNFLFLE